MISTLSADTMYYIVKNYSRKNERPLSTGYV